MTGSARFIWDGVAYFYLASFPRSGNHFVRYMIDDVLAPKYHHSNPVFRKFMGCTRVVWPRLENPSLKGAELVMVKTHLKYEYMRPGIPIVYLVRDPRDSIVSYYFYNVAHHDYTESFDEYFQRYVIDRRFISKRERVLGKYMDDWNENVLSFRDREGVLVKRYEDLSNDTAHHLMEICAFVAIDERQVTAEAVAEAVEKAMLRLDQKQAVGGQRKRGKVGAWRDVMSESQNAILIEKYAEGMLMHDYHDA